MTKTKTTGEPTPKTARPDAVKVPVGLVVRDDLNGRVHGVLDVAEPLLECDKINGEHGHARLTNGGYHLVTRSDQDTEFGAIGTAGHGMPRYFWTDRGDGVLVGRLRGEAGGSNGS